MSLTLNNWWTFDKWITIVTWQTSANWCMVWNSTECVNSTRRWTRVFTLFILAHLIASTVGINCTFRPAVRWTSNIVWQTRADWSSTQSMADSVWPTDVRNARILARISYYSRLYNTPQHASAYKTKKLHAAAQPWLYTIFLTKIYIQKGCTGNDTCILLNTYSVQVCIVQMGLQCNQVYTCRLHYG